MTDGGERSEAMLAMTEEVRVTVPDSYYTPERVRALLRLYPYLGDSRPPIDPELAGLSRRAFGPGGWREESMTKRADIGRALSWLAGRDWRAAYCVRARYCVGLPLRDIAGYLEREHGASCSHETVRQWTIDAIPLMARFLSGIDVT